MVVACTCFDVGVHSDGLFRTAGVCEVIEVDIAGKYFALHLCPCNRILCIDAPDTVFGYFRYNNGAWVFTMGEISCKQRIHIDMVTVFELLEVVFVLCYKVEPEERFVFLPAVFVNTVGSVKIFRCAAEFVPLYHGNPFFKSEVPL